MDESERYDVPHKFRVPMAGGGSRVVEAYSKQEAYEKARTQSYAEAQTGAGGPAARDVNVPYPEPYKGGVQEIPYKELLDAQLPPGEESDPSKELPGIMLRADLAQGSQLAVDQAAKIRESLFGNEAIQTRILRDPVTEEAIVLARIPGSDRFVPIDTHDVTWGDFGDIAGHLATPENLMMVAGAAALNPIAMGARGVPPLLANMSRLQKLVRFGQAGMRWGQRAGTMALGVGGGSFAGSMAGSEIERLRGFNSQPFSEDVREAEMNARLMRDMEIGMRGIGPILGRAAQPLVSSVFLHKGHAERAAIEVAQFLGVSLVAADLHPIGRSALQIVARLGSRAEAFQLDRLSTALRSIGKWGLSLGSVKRLTTEKLERVAAQWEQEILSAVDAPLGKYRPGYYAQAGAVTYDVLSRERVNRLYTTARRLDPSSAAMFDISAAREVANKWRIGITGKPASGTLRGAGGRFEPIPTPQGDPSLPVRLSPPLGGQAKKLITDLLAVSPSLETRVSSSALEQMQALRTRAFNLMKDYSEHVSGADRKMAGELHHALSESLYNPLSAPEGFADALRKAGAANANREKALDGIFLKTVLGTQSKRDIGEVLMDPANYRMLRQARTILKGVGDDAGWERVKDGFKQKLLGDPVKLGRLMKDPANERGLAILLTPRERDTFLKMGREYDRFQSSLLVKHLRLQRGLGKHAVTIIKEAKGDPGAAAELSVLVERMGGKDSAGGRALQAGIVEYLTEQSTVLRLGREITDTGRFEALAKELDQSGLLKEIMTDENIAKLRDVRTLLSYIPSRAGTGEGLVTAMVGAEFSKLNPLRMASGLSRILGSYTMGRLYLSDFTARAAGLPKITQYGIVPTEISYLRLLAEGLASAADLAESDAMQMLSGKVGKWESKVMENFEDGDVDLTPIPVVQGGQEEFDEINKALANGLVGKIP